MVKMWSRVCRVMAALSRVPSTYLGRGKEADYFAVFSVWLNVVPVLCCRDGQPYIVRRSTVEVVADWNKDDGKPGQLTGVVWMTVAPYPVCRYGIDSCEITQSLSCSAKSDNRDAGCRVVPELDQG